MLDSPKYSFVIKSFLTSVCPENFLFSKKKSKFPIIFASLKFALKELTLKIWFENFKSNSVESKIASFIFNLSILKFILISLPTTGMFTNLILGKKREVKFSNKLDISFAFK